MEQDLLNAAAQAVDALLHDADDGARRHLEHALASHQGWSLATQLARDAAHHRRHFAAVALAKKARAEWYALPQHLKTHVYRVLWEAVARAATTTETDRDGWPAVAPAERALCHALAAAAARSFGELPLLADTLALLERGCAAEISVAMCLLAAYADEADPSGHRLLARDKATAARGLIEVLPQVWRALTFAVRSEARPLLPTAAPTATASTADVAGDPVRLALAAAQSLVRWVPLQASAGSHLNDLRELLVAAAVRVPPPVAGAADWRGHMARARAAAELMGELTSRCDAGRALEAALDPVLSSLAQVLARLADLHAATATLDSSAASALAEYEARLGYFLIELSQRWLVRLSPRGALGLVSALPQLIGPAASGRGELFGWRCVEAVHGILESSAQTGDGLSDGPAVELADAALACLPRVLEALDAAAARCTRVPARVCAVAAAEVRFAAGEGAAATTASAAAADYDDDDGDDDEEEELTEALSAASSLVEQLTLARPTNVLSGLGRALEVAATASSRRRAGAVVALLGTAVSASSSSSRGSLSQLLRTLVPVLASATQLAEAATGALDEDWNVALALSRLALGACDRLNEAAAAESVQLSAEEAASLQQGASALMQSLVILLRRARSDTPMVATVSALALSTAARRWSASLHECGALERYHRDLLALVAEAPARAQPLLAAAAACAVLLPARDLPEPLPAHAVAAAQMLSSLCATLASAVAHVEQCAATNAAVASSPLPPAATDSLVVAEVPLRCLAAVIESMACEQRALRQVVTGLVQQTLEQRLLPLLEIAVRPSARRLQVATSALLPILAAARALSDVLGPAFVATALGATLSAIAAASADVLRACGSATQESDASAFLSVALGVLRTAADPPGIRTPAVRAELRARAAAALAPSALGSLLQPQHSSDGVPEETRAQLLDLVGSLIEAHWGALKERPSEAAALASLLLPALDEPSALATFGAACTSLRGVVSLQLRGSSPPPPWLVECLAAAARVLIAARLETTHAAVHDDIDGLLHASFTLCAHPGGSAAECAAAWLREFLDAHCASLALSARAHLIEDFTAAGPRDAATFALQLAAFANDARHLLETCAA